MIVETGLLGLALLGGAYQPDPELTSLMRPPFDGYAARRDALLTKDESIRPRLVPLTSHGDPGIRGLAEAMLVRLDQPDDAEALDTWEVPEGLFLYHNADFMVESAVYSTFRTQPALAFERLVTEHPRCLHPPALIRVVAKGPDAFNRLEVLLDRYPRAATYMVEIDPTASVVPILASIRNGGESWPGIHALTRACVRDDELLRLLREVAGDVIEGPRESAIVALGRLQDRESVEVLKGGLHQTDHDNARLISLLQILGPSGFWDELVAMAVDENVFTRRAAAKVLGRDEAGPVGAREAVLAALVEDPDSDVRTEALESVVLLLRSYRRYAECSVSAEMESAVLEAAAESDSGFQEVAFTALRLIFGQHPCRPLTKPALERAVEVAVFDPGPWLRPRRLEGLNRFLGDDADVVILIVHDLGELRDDRRNDEMVRLALSRHGPLTEEKVAALGVYDIVKLNALVALWRQRVIEGIRQWKQPNRSPFRYPAPPTSPLNSG